MDCLVTQGWFECEDDDDSLSKKIDKNISMEFYSFIMLCYRMATEHVKSFSFVKMNVRAETLFDLVSIISSPSSFNDYYDTLAEYRLHIRSYNYYCYFIHSFNVKRSIRIVGS